MELSNLEEHRQEAERSQQPPPITGTEEEDPERQGASQDPEQQRAELRKEESKHGESGEGEPDARDGAATNPGGAGF